MLGCMVFIGLGFAFFLNDTFPSRFTSRELIQMHAILDKIDWTRFVIRMIYIRQITLCHTIEKYVLSGSIMCHAGESLFLVSVSSFGLM